MSDKNQIPLDPKFKGLFDFFNSQIVAFVRYILEKMRKIFKWF
jgi:hypothetical protein